MEKHIAGRSRIGYRTSSLFHYTSMECLKAILREGFYPNYCKEDFSIGEKDYIVGIPMVSFCDIPLTRAASFMDRYKSYAISLKKEWALEKGINPILYINNMNIISALQLYKNHENALLDKVKEYGGNEYSISVLLNKSGDIPELVNFINMCTSSSANRYLWGFSKKYWNRERDICNYEENEWRYIVPEFEDVKWLWGGSEYDKWRGSKEDEKPQANASLKQCKLQFEVSDITHLIVKKDEDVFNLIEYINVLDFIAGSNELSDSNKSILISKITTVDKIERDF